jgi:sugar transferase (PEP-CTERM/EpsH1 system associated)
VNILVVSPWFPSPAFGGALIRVRETLRHLARQHRVTLLAPVARRLAAEDSAAIRALGVTLAAVPVPANPAMAAKRIVAGMARRRSLLESLHFHPAMARELRRLTAANQYEIVHLEHSFMARYLDSIGPECGARTVLSMHNIESLRFSRELRDGGGGLRRAALFLDRAVARSWEEAAVRRFDGVATVSAAEGAWVRRHAPSAAVALVPNGVDVSHFAALPPTTGSRRIVFSGLMNYPPNADAVLWFCDAVLPLVVRRYPDVRFSIVGDKPTAPVARLARRPNVDVTGRVPDVRPYLADAAVAVVPVKSGAGTRLKILEAMAMQRPVVATTLGAEGLEIAPGKNILLGDSAHEFAEQVCAVLADSQLAGRLGREGRRLVEERYDWTSCLSGLNDLYGSLAGTRIAKAQRQAVAS